MVYLDSSVVLAYLLAEDRCPPDSLWNQDLVSSRLLEYEVWNRIHVYRSAAMLGEAGATLLGAIQLIEMTPTVLSRALHAFPVSIRTLDSLHLATAEHLRERGQEISLASFDLRLLAGARALNIQLYEF
jgi:predicted nucleic acid-binding protein